MCRVEGSNNPDLLQPRTVTTVSDYDLQEESEADPLVVPVLHHLLLVDDGAHARVGNLTAHLSVDELREGEGGVNPAVGVHHAPGHLLQVGRVRGRRGGRVEGRGGPCLQCSQWGHQRTGRP